MGKGFAFIAIIAAAAIALLNYGKTAKSLLALKAQFNGLKVHSISLTEIILKVNLSIVNSNSSTVTANKITANILYQGDVISTVNWDGTLNLPGDNQTTNINGIQFNVKNMTALPLLYKAIKGDAGSVKFTINGRITADGNTYPVETTLKLS